MNLQVEGLPYFRKEYDNKSRFISYWHQINEIIKLNPKRVLEIGVRNKFVSKYLKERGVNVTTLDIDKRLNPEDFGLIGIAMLNMSTLDNFSQTGFRIVIMSICVYIVTMYILQKYYSGYGIMDEVKLVYKY